MDILDIGSVLAGLVLLCIGGYAIVSGGVSLAKKLRISSMIIGLTVVAYGTSTPELAASLLAAFNSHTELILGNIVGSNVSNVGMVIGISAIFTPLLISKITVSRWIPIMIGVSLLVVAMSYDGEISQIDGVLLIAALIGFTAYTIRTVKKQKIQQNETVENEALEGEYFLSKFKIETYPQSFGLIAAGVILLFLGGHLTVDGAVNIAENLGLSHLVIGVVIVAIGTSLPELITSIIAIAKKQTDIGVGNIVGSNIYNILLILGVSSTIVGIPVSADVFSNYYIMIAFSLVLFIGFRKSIPRFVGIGLTIAFVTYLVSLLLNFF
ncbi:MAG: calcium/sodium antiporter [Thaumarchaeota archaeon]|nr:calcium/sodium antiporter [Nitrososphaerota archaeon]MDC0856816.1 calcium/sodium antiporter [Candidatus Nitrosopelagicus sp.]MBT3743289.1 calcium/sodium antiporter [Nitrososphaerota archaeon]MBT4057046.1 calcium/sodium antiporter [Nitrososphaerota archaeon]MBT4175677.1 calcium/sodium antiporter [Nitrososphaerota archaeon]